MAPNIVNSMLKELFLSLMGASGILNITRNLSTSFSRIIAYHGFAGPKNTDPSFTSSNAFRRQLEYIKKHYTPMTLGGLVQARITDGEYPRNAVVITVDDGYENFFEWAFPLLKELEVPATSFVVPKVLDIDGWLWFDRLTYLFGLEQRVFFQGVETELGPWLEKLKLLPATQRDSCAEELIREAGTIIPSRPTPEYALMSWAQLHEVAASGLVEIGSHTCTHPILAHTNEEESWEEFSQSRGMIENKLNIEVKSFCYPNGMPGDYLPVHLQMLRRAGYSSAVASHFGMVNEDSDLFSLPRFGVDPSFQRFRKYLDGAEYFQQRLLHLG